MRRGSLLALMTLVTNGGKKPRVLLQRRGGRGAQAELVYQQCLCQIKRAMSRSGKRFSDYTWHTRRPRRPHTASANILDHIQLAHRHTQTGSISPTQKYASCLT